jgi:hypothetical protein
MLCEKLHNALRAAPGLFDVSPTAGRNIVDKYITGGNDDFYLVLRKYWQV